MPDIKTLLSIAPSVSAIVAVLTFIVYVGNTIREQRRAFRELRSEATDATGSDYQLLPKFCTTKETKQACGPKP